MDRETKIYLIRDKIGKACSLLRVMTYCKSKKWNFVISQNGKIFFNKAGTKKAAGSYREAYRDLDEMWIDAQSDETVDFIYSLCK